MNISTRKLKVFLLIARLKNFTRSRAAPYQPGRPVDDDARTELQLTSRLFDRTTRSLTLTAASEKLLPIA